MIFVLYGFQYKNTVTEMEISINNISGLSKNSSKWYMLYDFRDV